MSQIKVLSELGSGEVSLPVLQVAALWPYSHMAFPLNVYGERQRKQKDLWYLFLFLQGHQSNQVRIPSL